MQPLHLAFLWVWELTQVAWASLLACSPAKLSATLTLLFFFPLESGGLAKLGAG